MLTALILFTILVALKNAGAKSPFIDKTLNKINNKLQRNKTKNQNLDVESVGGEINSVSQKSDISPNNTFKQVSYAKIYSGDLRI